MSDTEEDSLSSDYLSISSDQPDVPQSKTSSYQVVGHYFHVHCLSKKVTLKGIFYTSVNDIKKAAFALYPSWTFNDDNAILTYLDNNKVEVLLISVPDLPEKGHSKDLFIRFVHPVCSMCSNPFGIVDSQRLLQCSEVKCGVQYCNNCVEASQSPPPKRLFVCIACKKSVIPQRNTLIEKHIIWKSMCKLYGADNLLDLKQASTKMSCRPILTSIELLRIHLQSQLITFLHSLGIEKSHDLFDEQLIHGIDDLFDQELFNNVKDLCLELKDLTKKIDETNQEMRKRGAIVSTSLEKYKKGMKHFDRLCNELMQSIEKLETNSSNITIDMNNARKEHIKELYRTNNLNELSSKQNIETIDDILGDLSFRKQCLSSYLEMITSLVKNKPEEVTLLNDNLDKAKKKLEMMSVLEEELNLLRGNVRGIERFTDEYDNLLRDDQFQDIPCSKCILLLERMRVRTEELQISKIFPQTTHLMRKWQNDYSTDGEFKPKVIDLFRAVEMEVKHLLSNDNCIYSLPYKIGVVGHGSVGKSALVINLTNMHEFSSMIAMERSTFGFLQFDTLIYKHSHNGKTIPITFVDIEGTTDTDQSQSSGNYIELISKADCDLYIIVFDNSFSGHNRTCQEYIENSLQRKCLLVRSKADSLFNIFFSQITGKKYDKIHSIDFDVKDTLSEIKTQVSKTFDIKCLKDEVYLTAARCHENNLKDAPFGNFDLDKLKKKLAELAITDFRVKRVCKLAILASITVINTCFRRAYTVSQTKYRWLAAGASLIPFLDEVPAFFGREKIRQAFGIHDRFAVTNTILRTEDAFEKYLKENKFTVPKKGLKSGYFKYLIPKKTEQAITSSAVQLDSHIQQKSMHIVQDENLLSQNVGTALRATGHAVARLSTVVSASDDVSQFILPVATAGLHAVSIAGIVVAVVLTPAFAAWSHYSAGKRMSKHLHLLCNDLVLILYYFAQKICNDCSVKIQPDIPSLSINDSSSSDDDEAE